MKKLNRKGFTLVELLVVLVILVVIMSIAIPSVTSSIERSKQKQYDSKVELVMSAAEIYIDRHKNSVGTNGIVTIIDLVDDGLITKEQAKNPFDESRTICGYYSYSSKEWKDDCTKKEIDVNGNEVGIDLFLPIS